MNRSTPGLPVHHQLPESTQTHAHRVSDAIQPSHSFWEGPWSGSKLEVYGLFLVFKFYMLFIIFPFWFNISVWGNF